MKSQVSANLSSDEYRNNCIIITCNVNLSNESKYVCANSVWNFVSLVIR